MVKLKASNFILRSWKKGDEKQLLEQINNEKILEHMREVFPDPVTLESVKKIY